MRAWTAFTFGMIFGLLVGVWLTVPANGADIYKITDSPTNAQRTAGPPQFSMGVVQCGEVVAIWVITSDGKIFRTDAEHHPDAKDYEDFLSWLQTAKQDIYVLPCPGEKAGGKTHKREST